MSDEAGRALQRRMRAVFGRFVAALNRRDTYELEREDVDRPVSPARREVLDARLVAVREEIAAHEVELTRLAQRLDDLESERVA